MEPVTIASLVLSIVGIGASLITPVIGAFVLFVGRIKHSQCCGGSSIDLADPTNQPPMHQPVNPIIDLSKPAIEMPKL